MTEEPNTEEPIPLYVKLALSVILQHVEPGWEHCVTVIRQWLQSKEPE